MVEALQVANNVMKKLDFLTTPTQDDGTAAYEPFPAEGEPVFVSHPAFIYDSWLREVLDSWYLMLAITIRLRGDNQPEHDPEFDAQKDWLAGRTPILPEDLAEILEMRAEKLVRKGLPADKPIGWERLEQMKQDGTAVEQVSTADG